MVKLQIKIDQNKTLIVLCNKDYVKLLVNISLQIKVMCKVITPNVIKDYYQQQHTLHNSQFKCMMLVLLKEWFKLIQNNINNSNMQQKLILSALI